MPLSPLIRRVVTVVVVFTILNSTGYAQAGATPSQLVDSMIRALGGQRFLDVKEIQTEGRFFTFKRDEVATSDSYADYLKFPDRERTEFGKDKLKTVQINRGLEGWTIKPPEKGKGDPQVEVISQSDAEEFLKGFKTSFDYVARFVVSNPRNYALNAGSEVVDARRADVLEVRDSEKNLMRIYIDRETHLPLKMQTRLATDSTLNEEAYANWHAFDGVMTPLMVVRYKDSVKRMEIRVQSAKYDAGFPDSLFAPPAKSK